MRTIYTIQLSPVRIAIADLMEIDGVWWINRINVPNGYRGRGHGTALLMQILEQADYEEVTLRLNINPYGDLNYHQLQSWYERYGFVQDEEGCFTRKPQ